MNENSNTKEVKKKNNDLKGITFVSVGILTLIVAIAGATFAYFAVTATNNNITGTSGYVANALTLSVTEKTSIGTSKLIPQKDQAIQNAVTAGCKDSNNNAICKVFQITITNATTTQYYVDGTLTFSSGTMPNLKWAKGTSATAGFPSSTTGPFYAPSNSHVITTGTTANYSTLASDIVLAGGASTNFFIVVWISETNASQTDSGSFTGTVSFTGSNAAGTSTGITSTITS